MAKPAFSKLIGGIQIAAWRNTSKNSGREYLSYTISKRYKDPKTGDWKDGSFYGTDLPIIQELCAYMFARCEMEGLPAVAEEPGQPSAF